MDKVQILQRKVYNRLQTRTKPVLNQQRNVYDRLQTRTKHVRIPRSNLHRTPAGSSYNGPIQCSAT